MFRNHLRAGRSSTPINLALARLLTSAILAGGLLSNLAAMNLSPWPLEPFPSTWVVIATLGSLLLVFLGVYLPWTALLSSLLVGAWSLAEIQAAASPLGELLLACSVFLFLLALFDEQDELSLDGLRRTAKRGLDALNEHLKTRREHASTPLAGIVLLLAVAYLLHALVGAWSLGLPAAWTPQGFAALARVGIGLGLLAAVGLSEGRGFDGAVLFLVTFEAFRWAGTGALPPAWLALVVLLVDWERLLAHLQPHRALELVYDEDCLFCAQSLYAFKHLDALGNVRFFSQSDMPDKHARNDAIRPKEAMYASDGDTVHRGYHAFRRLFETLPLMLPVGLVMRLGPIARVGERVYGHVAKNRHRYATCAISPED